MSVRGGELEPVRQSVGSVDGWLRRLCARASFAATAVSLVLTLLLSVLVLEQIGLTHYASSGGTIFEKVHPGTWMAMMALALRMASEKKPFASLRGQLRRTLQLLLYGLAVLAAGAHAALVSKTPITPLIDTFMLPALYFLLLEKLDERSLRLLAWLVGVILAANALVGLVEYVTGGRLIPIDLPANVTDDPRHSPALVFDWRAALAKDWRPTALLGHPLTNADITGVFVTAICARDAGWIAPGLRFGLLMLEMLALFCFGGRAALVVTLIVVSMISAGWLLRFLGGGVRVSLRRWAYVLLASPLLFGALYALIEAGFFDRMIGRFSNDRGSAATRTKMFELFRAFDAQSLLLGPDPAVLATQQRLQGLEFGIESFVIDFMLQYGALVAMLLFAGLGAFVAAIMRACGRGAGAALLVFFVVGVTSESIGAKTTEFGLVVAIVMLFIRPIIPPVTGPRRQSPRQDLGRPGEYPA